MLTYTKLLNTPLLSARVLLYHSSEQLTGINKKKNHISYNNPNYSDSLSEDYLF